MVLDGGVPQVRPPVVVHVFEIYSHAGESAAALGIGDTGFQRNLFELFAAEIMKEEVGMIVVGDKNIDESIMVVVGDGHAHSLPEELGDSRFRGDIGKGAVAIVAVQGIREVCIIVAG